MQLLLDAARNSSYHVFCGFLLGNTWKNHGKMFCRSLTSCNVFNFILIFDCEKI